MIHRIVGLVACVVVLGACNSQQNDELSKPIAPIKPAIEFDLTATAKRVDTSRMLIEVTDKSQDGARILGIQRPNIDTFQDQEGNSVQASLRDYRLLKTEGEDASDTFALQLLFQGRIPQEIGLLSGTIEVSIGDPEEIELKVDSEAIAADPKLSKLGIEVDVDFKTKVEIDLSGENVARGFLVIGEGEEENSYGGFGSSGNDSALRSWRLGQPPTEGQEIRFWKSEGDRNQSPAWTIKPVKPGLVENAELGLSGQISFSTIYNLVVKGPKDKLIAARLLDQSGQPADQRPQFKAIGSDHQWAFSTSRPNCTLQVRICENTVRAAELLEFKDLKVESAR